MRIWTIVFWTWTTLTVLELVRSQQASQPTINIKKMLAISSLKVLGRVPLTISHNHHLNRYWGEGMAEVELASTVIFLIYTRMINLDQGMFKWILWTMYLIRLFLEILEEMIIWDGMPLQVVILREREVASVFQEKSELITWLMAIIPLPLWKCTANLITILMISIFKGIHMEL